MRDNQTVLTPPADTAHLGKGAKDTGAKVFAFDKSYWSFSRDDNQYAGQSHLFDDLGRPLLDNAFQGYNNCIFAYGQTGSGKSYSMMGYGKEVGIIPNICQDMFRRIDDMHDNDKTLRCTVEVSYLEIYNERVRDLLNPSTKGNLKVREHPSTGPYVEDLAKLAVSSFQEIENLMDEGNKARTVAATNMNETSSRSHAVFTLMLTQKKYDIETKMEMEKVAKISLVDLAGSERATSTGATGARLKEGAEINRSLSTLGRVIAALADLSTGKKKKGATAQVPYRDSVLTWLLKDSLGGNSMTAMIAAISPADINYDETLSTLRYADSAKRIKNHAVINEDANARMIRELKEELALLRSQLGGGAAVTTAGGVLRTAEVYPEGTPLEKQMVTITAPDGTTKTVSKAEITEQLTQSEKLLSDLNQTWEQKLAKTEEIHKEREAALQELGISIQKGFVGISTPKKMPNLVNLSDDPLLDECLVYPLKPGITTVGNVDTNADHQANIRLTGTRILHDHCAFENGPDGTVTLIPIADASVMVNGQRITEPKQLHSGYRIILGDFHIFRFNHPMEAKAERAERGENRSLLRQSIHASQLQALERTSPTPTPRPGHDRSHSRAMSEVGDFSRPESPAPWKTGRDSDWSFARREAAGAILGIDQNLNSLTDEELNALFEDVSRARAERVNGREGEEDSESCTSYPIREKYLSTGTIDNFSLDTALTMPSTPKQGEVDEKSREMREELQAQLERQKEEYEAQIKAAEASNVEVEEIKKEKSRMVEEFKQLKTTFQAELATQRKHFEERLEKMDPLKRRKANPRLSDEEMELAKKAIRIWRGRRFVQMAEAVLQYAATLKEAQIMSNELDEQVVFQFAVVDVGHTLCSSYDIMINDVTLEDDAALVDAPKPCIGVRLIDYKSNVIRLWSLSKLHDRVRQMRQVHQYLDQPEFAQHIEQENPFVEPSMPHYSLIGEADVPLRAVFECRVQDLTIDVLSPFTSQAIGRIRLSLEPSHAHAPNDMLKFNVIMHEMTGFAEREGTDVHAQLFIPGVSEEDGITTTQMIKDFDEGPIRFGGCHSMSIPQQSPGDINLRVAIFAMVSSLHLDRLRSWDEVRDAIPSLPGQEPAARIAETQFYTPEKHDLLAQLQVLELNEEAEYDPVDVVKLKDTDAGCFQIHQGMQRQVLINLTHSSGDTLSWDEVTCIRIGSIQLLDSAGKSPDSGPASSSPDVVLTLASKPIFRDNVNGTKTVQAIGIWDSSQHASPLLNKTTKEGYRVQMTLAWEIASSTLAEPMKFSSHIYIQVLSRTHVRQASMLGNFFHTSKVVKSCTAMFTLTMRPAPIKRVEDLWRMNSQHDYVKGEEHLSPWSPRGVSLVKDYILSRKRRHMMLDIGAVQNLLRKIGLPEPRKGFVEEAPPSQPDSILQIDDADLLNDTPEPSQTVDEEAEAEPDEADAELDADLDEADAEDNEPTLTLHGAVNGDNEPGMTIETNPDTASYKDDEKELLSKCVKLWQRYPNPLLRILSQENTNPPANGVTTESPTPNLITTIIRVHRNPRTIKSGFLLVPNTDSTRWVKRFVELRRPYLHVYSATTGDEVAIVSLRNSRCDSQPGILALLHGGTVHDGEEDHASSQQNGRMGPTQVTQTGHRRTSSGRVISTIWTGMAGTSPSKGQPGQRSLNEKLRRGVFAIYATDNTWLFAAKSERDKGDWITAIDQTYMVEGTVHDRYLGSGATSPLGSAGIGRYPSSDTGSNY
jgi:kinesin family member 1